MLSTVDAQRFSHFTPEELKLVRGVYLEISQLSWFRQDLKAEFGAYVINMYQRGMVYPDQLRGLCIAAARNKYSIEKV